MKIKNKLFTVIVSLSLILSITGCNKSTNSDNQSGTTGVIVDADGNVVGGNIANENSLEQQPQTKQQEFSGDINVDILSRHLLPSFERMEVNDRTELVDSLQVIKKIKELALDAGNFLYPEKNLSELRITLEKITSDIPESMERVEFSGSTSDEFQSFINDNIGKAINITSEKIAVTSEINIPTDTYISGNNAEFEASSCDNVFVANSVKNVIIDSIVITGNANYGVFIADSENITVKNSNICGMGQKGICVVGNSHHFCLKYNEVSRNSAGGIYCAANVSEGTIQNNIINENSGTSNWMAGVVLTNVNSQNPMNIWETFDTVHHFPVKVNLYSQVNCPHNIVIENNEISENNASGIYSDGSYNCYVINNDVIDNDKEGICLDYGTIGFYLNKNLFEKNGRRIRQSDDDLKMDFVFDAGRMDDGSAKSKLPGVSIDNAAYNILENNTVVNNYGGGIKMVRTGIRNLIMENIVKDNNQGQNDAYHFFGIELGSALADVEATDMDFTPDFENIICRNVISGNHYSGVFIGEDGYVNDIFDNIVIGPQMFAIEAISSKFNSIINNFSNADIRNEYKG